MLAVRGAHPLVPSAESGTTMLLVTHDEHVARRAERVLEIRDGRIGV
jgi:predicted ABC-type transport system involved in lysophospholipase L1 biosynthesis ATPase subunit